MSSLKNLILATSFALVLQVQADDPVKQKNGKTPAVCPSTCDLSTDGTYRVSVLGEFIYWKPLEGGTEFTFPTRTTAPIPGTTSPSYVPFKYEPGLRIGAKYCLPYNGWNTSFTALNLSSNVSTSLSGVLFPLQAAQSVIQNPISQFTSATSASAHWKLNYWVFDYRLGCEHPFCENFLVNPYCGVKGAIIHQTFRYNYNNVSEPCDE